MPHRNAILTETGRLHLAQLVVDQGWTLRRAAERFGVAVNTARRWAQRYREQGLAGMVDKSSRPKHCPHQLSQRTERRIVGLRVTKRWGPARIAYHLHLNPSTVHKVIRRYGCPPLRWTDPATGARIKTSRAEKRRYEHAAPGDLVHVDIKKLGRIPDGGGHKVLGRAAGTRNKTRTATNRRPGYAYIHNAVDDHSRLAYSEILTEVLSNPVDEPSQAACWMAWSEGSGSTSLPSLKVAPARTLATRWGARIARHLFCADCISLNAIAIPAARLPGPFVTR